MSDKKIKPGYIYQKLLNNQENNNIILDLRLLVFLNRFPFLYLKYRKITDRFSNTNHLVKVVEISEYLSEEETRKISLFCQEIGLDIGELDMIRNKDDGKLYIIDVNNTCYGPPNHILSFDENIALDRLCYEFKRLVEKKLFL